MTPDRLIVVTSIRQDEQGEGQRARRRGRRERRRRGGESGGAAAAAAGGRRRGGKGAGAPTRPDAAGAVPAVAGGASARVGSPCPCLSQAAATGAESLALSPVSAT